MPNAQTTKVFGLLGKHVDYSWSPLIHNTGFNTLGLPCIYTIFNIASQELVGDALRGSLALGISGFNVTIPFKKTVVPFLDELSPEARVIGAVNTIVNNNGRLIGHNTDIAGFAAPLLPMAESIRNKPVCIFGNGGAALAALEAFRLRFSPSSVLLMVRDMQKAEAMLEEYAYRDLATLCPAREIDQPACSKKIRECRVVVNATPVGTAGRCDHVHNILPTGHGVLHEGQIVYDMVYNPPETPMLADARSVGAMTIPGIDMLIAQAARSFFIWTGQELPLDIVRKTVLAEIAKNGA
ncbi:MAG: shikimate dehydrogenase [Chlorobiaceae bacterium]|nr:shikimate dehydrogenase [Chlorobiaceae bacterium]